MPSPGSRYATPPVRPLRIATALGGEEKRRNGGFAEEEKPKRVKEIPKIFPHFLKEAHAHTQVWKSERERRMRSHSYLFMAVEEARQKKQKKQGTCSTEHMLHLPPLPFCC